MSATHQLTLVSRDGATLTLEIRTSHEDVRMIPLRRTALVSMLYASLPEHDTLPEAVVATYEAAGGDEPDDARAARRVVVAVSDVEVVQGVVRSQSSQRVQFISGGGVRVRVELARAELAAHLQVGSTWDAAPLFGG